MFVRKFADWIQFANGTKCSRTGSVRGWDGTYIPAPVSYLTLKPPGEVNTIYTLPGVFFMEPPIPSVIYLPGKIQEIIPALPPPGANLVLVKAITT